MEENRKVYSTQQGRLCPDCKRTINTCICKEQKRNSKKGSGKVRVSREVKGRGGKTVTVVAGLAYTQEELREFATELKRKFGVGGAVKDGSVEIQGDHSGAVMKFLLSKGIQAKRSGG